MRSGLLAALLLQIASTPNPRYFLYTRTVIPATQSPQACALLDPPIFAHASPTLADLRLYSHSAELPYAITISESTLAPPDPARILNLGLRNKNIAFDVAMPPRPYTELALTLTGENFIAAAQVSGLKAATNPHPTALGTFTLFDLTAQHLSRSTTIPLPESSFPLLHIELTVTPTPGSTFVPTPAMVQGAEIPPNREAQTLYTPVAATTHFTQRGNETVALIDIPAQIPIERVSFTLAHEGNPTNFSRTIRITAVPHEPAHAQPEILSGQITRIHLPATASTPAVDDQILTVPATLGANLKYPATVEFAIENGDDRPIPLASATLEMRQRKLCFAPQAGESITLDYGDPTLRAPVYDFARLFNPAAPTTLATLTPEQPNPIYIPRQSPARDLTERHPELLWLALLAVVATLAVVAFRSSKHIPPLSR